MKIRDLMRPSWSVRADDTLWQAERTMARHRLEHLPVLDAGKLVGVVSERELFARRAASTGEAWWQAPVRQAMHDAPPTAAPDEPASVAGDRIAASPDGLLPVIEHGFLVGVVTAIDVLDAELRVAAVAPAPSTAADVMTEMPVTVTPADSLVDATMLMADHHIRHLPVVESGVIVGMLSERDLLPLADELSSSLESRGGARLFIVRDAMTSDVKTVDPSTSLAEVSRTLIDERIGAVPVVDDKRRPLGIVSYVDLLRALAA